MKSYSELKSEMDNLEAQMEQAKKRERAEALKKVKQLCKEFGFTAGMLQGVLAKGRNSTSKT
jgi:DNA-binding protein H-NS